MTQQQKHPEIPGPISKKILSGEKVNEVLEAVRSNGKTVVFTNGCFDILHLGHIHVLTEASLLGDFLVVGLNSDVSVRRLKGPSRPVSNEHSRAALLAALEMVDAVILFDEDTPRELLEKVRPHILVKGGDYNAGEVVGHDLLKSYGGRTVIVPYLEGHSTSGLIDKLQRS